MTEAAEHGGHRWASGAGSGCREYYGNKCSGMPVLPSFHQHSIARQFWPRSIVLGAALDEVRYLT